MSMFLAMQTLNAVRASQIANSKRSSTSRTNTEDEIVSSSNQLLLQGGQAIMELRENEELVSMFIKQSEYCNGSKQNRVMWVISEDDSQDYTWNQEQVGYETIPQALAGVRAQYRPRVLQLIPTAVEDDKVTKFILLMAVSVM